ncbi:MAG: hypothetical protein KJ963_06260 [Bacteroidetes bacterium]|nr:hypothetical protein [Bacteroidota bacterium]
MMRNGFILEAPRSHRKPRDEENESKKEFDNIKKLNNILVKSEESNVLNLSASTRK